RRAAASSRLAPRRRAAAVYPSVPSRGAAPPPTRAPGAAAAHSAAESISRRARFLGDDRLVAHELPQVVDLLGEVARAHDLLGIALREARLDDLLDAAGARRHHRDAVREIDRLTHVMGDEDHGLGGAPDDGEQLLMHERARLRVERPERLVHQQDRRLDRQRARDGDALLHAARELRRETVLEALEVDEVDQLLRALLAFGARPALLLQAVKDVLPHRLPRVEREILEDDAAVGPGAGNRTPGDGDAPRL